jgi:DNA invertase Pin-like site-specific DNA recombinase
MENKTLTYLVPSGSEARSLKPGDILIVNEAADENLSVVRIDTLLSEVWEKQQKGHFQTGAIAADMVQQIFNHLDQMEKSHKHKRHAEGIAAAKARGAKFGRKPKERPEMLDSVHELWKQGEISAREAGKRLGISHVTFLSWVGEG